MPGEARHLGHVAAIGTFALVALGQALAMRASALARSTSPLSTRGLRSRRAARNYYDSCTSTLLRTSENGDKALVPKHWPAKRACAFGPLVLGLRTSANLL